MIQADTMAAVPEPRGSTSLFEGAFAVPRIYQGLFPVPSIFSSPFSSAPVARPIRYAPWGSPQRLPARPSPLPPDVLHTLVDALATALVAEVQGR